MGDFLGHVLPGFFFLCVGLWHLTCTISSYVSSPATFKSRVWHPVEALPHGAQPLELYAIMLGTAADIFYELGPSADFKPLRGGAIPTFMVSDFEHAGMLTVFFLFALAVLLSERTLLLPLPPGATHVLAAVAFGTELLLFHYHSIDHMGLEAQLHTLLTYAIGACLAPTLAALWHPRSFLLDVLTNAAIVLQGTWFLQMAFSLYVKGFIPTGCVHHAPLPSGEDGSTTCLGGLGGDAMHRAAGVMNLAFNLHIVGVLLLSLAIFAVTFRLRAPTQGYSELGTEMVPPPGDDAAAAAPGRPPANGFPRFAIVDEDLED